MQAREIDAHVGRQMRKRRQALGLSQERLAEGLGITFQQVQKYEKATNRVAASTLYRAAAILDCPPQFFFDGLPRPDAGRAQP